ncbi:MAG: LytR family transcriptional regulator [Thermoleophilia bacterium]|nr:LytR family transcriptional regulator [Thermoleophilia bacterium]
MDWLDVIILAAAGTGLIAFVVLVVIILRQGRLLNQLEERVGPPVPAAAAPALERVRGVPSSTVVANPSDGPAPPAPRRTARQEFDARAEAEAVRRAEAQMAAGRSNVVASAGRGYVLATLVVLLIGLLGAGSWYLFFRGDGGPARGTATVATSTTPGAGAIPEDVPPLANKAAYTVAVLNASGVTGAAATRVAPRVQAVGYTLGVVDNASTSGLAISVVEYVKGRQEVGWNLAKDLGLTTALEVTALSKGRIGTADAAVIVGADFAK